ncbi:MAG: glycogen/starch synthase [Candidatus Aminicenantes bacterium]|nr:glycogen/starch synthase [Candidatus Aminicenantes bacterium]
MKKKLRVLIVSPELAPLATGTGGLGEMVRLAAEEAAAQGAAVSIALPRYRVPAIEALRLEPVLPEFYVPVGTERVKAAAYRAQSGGLEVYLIDSAEYFLRDRLYGAEGAAYLDNDARFVFFARAVVELILKAKLAVDVVHCHDWPAALVPLFLRTHYAGRALLKDTASVLSVPEFDGKGRFPAESLAFTGLTWDYFTPEQLAQNGRFDFLKAGVVFSDALTGPAWAVPGAPPRGVDGNGWAEALARRAEAVVPPSRPLLEIYRQAIDNKKGVPHVR